jgi:murein DD-endopeptidase MepM/ murein hydrolase activator NlpD
MVRTIAKRRLRCAFFCGLLSAVAIGAAGCSSEVSRFGENSNRNSYSYVARAAASQPADAPLQPTRTAAVERQPLPQAQPTGSANAPQYAALQYEQPQYPPPAPQYPQPQYPAPQYAPPAPQYVPPQSVPPPSATPYAPPAPQYPQYPPYAPAAAQYTPQSAPPYAPPAPRSPPAFTGAAGGGARIADAAAPRAARSPAVPQAPAAPVPASSASLPAAPAQAAMPTSTSSAGSSAQTLLPTPPVYTVASGDTLGKVAHKYRVSVREIAVANGITPDTPLKLGERLTIPVRTGTPPGAHPGKPQPGGPLVAQTKPAPQTYTAAAAAAGRVASSETAANVRLASPVEAPSEAAPNGAPAFRWPVRGRIINNFGARVNGSPNDGIDLALPEGTAVRAAEDGVVAYAGNELKGYGNLVLVRHANGFVTAYANASELMVKRNDQVHKGQVILKSGQTGSAATPQLHFEIRKNSAPVDPMQYLPADKTASAPL